MENINTRKFVSLLLKIIVIIFASLGVLFAVSSSSDSFMGGTTVLMYFTIQSNIAIALICLIGIYYLFFKKDIPDWWYIIKYVGTLAITLTGAVFCFVLAPTMGNLVWNKVNIFTHIIVPISAIIDFFVIGIDSIIKRKHIIYTPIPSIIYLIYATLGYLLKWEFAPGINYPYFFLNWGSPAGAFGFSNELPYIGCFWWIIILTILILLVAFCYLKVLELLKNLINKNVKADE